MRIATSIFFILVLVAVGSGGHAAELTGEVLTPELATELAEAYQLDGVEPYFQQQAASVVREAMAEPLQHWTAEAIAEALTEQGKQLQRLALYDQQLRDAVEAKLKEKIAAALPDLVRTVLYDKLLRGAAGDELDQIEAIVKEVAARATTSLNAQLDQLATNYYSQLLTRISPSLIVCRLERLSYVNCIAAPSGLVICVTRLKLS